MNQFKKSLLTHGLILLAGIVLICGYFLPVFQGKVLQQGDIIQAAAMQHEINANQEKTGNYALWTNNLFSGMPAFMVTVHYSAPIIIEVFTAIETVFRNPVCYAIYYFIGFYLLLIVMGCSPWLSAIGALMFTFSSYNFIILEAGHNTKARCIGFIPFILAGLMLLFQKKYWVGALLCSLFLYVQIKSNHPQITYYMLLMIGLYFIYQLVETIRNKEWKNYVLVGAVFAGSMGIAVAANFAQLWVTYEYTKETMRGGSELAAGNTDSKKSKTGLDKDYAFMWSYGKLESLTLLIPDLYGGSSGGALDETSKVYQSLVAQGVPEANAAQYARSMPTYWGPKTFKNASTSGPVYLGVLVCFFFLLGILLLKDKWRWWIFATSGLALVLAWGNNFMFFNATFFDYFPMYNKFRTVEMSLVLLEVTMPLFAIVALKRILDGDFKTEEVMKKLMYATIGLGGVLLIFALMPSLFLDFKGGGDAELKKQLGSQSEGFASKIMAALMSDRESMAQMDAWRSLVFLLIAACTIWLFIKNKINKTVVLVIIGVAVLTDMWMIDRRYLNDDNYKEAEEINEPYNPTTADQQILQDTKTVSYRVFNVAVNPFNDALTSYHHKNIGGYNAAKLARYQDMIDSCIGKNNMNVINMLNTKYYIGKAQNGQEVAQLNPGAMGNAWFVDSVLWANSPREEMMKTMHLNPRTTAVIDASKFKDAVSKNVFEKDSTAKIKLNKNDLDVLDYTYSSAKEQLVVFSEVFYADEKGKGWQAFLDDKPVSHFRVNYILRGMVVPAGNHHIVFKFEPKPFLQGQKIAMISGWVLMLLMAIAIYMWWKENRQTLTTPEPEKPKENKEKKKK